MALEIITKWPRLKVFRDTEIKMREQDRGKVQKYSYLLKNYEVTNWEIS